MFCKRKRNTGTSTPMRSGVERMSDVSLRKRLFVVEDPKSTSNIRINSKRWTQKTRVYFANPFHWCEISLKWTAFGKEEINALTCIGKQWQICCFVELDRHCSTALFGTTTEMDLLGFSIRWFTLSPRRGKGSPFKACKINSNNDISLKKNVDIGRKRPTVPSKNTMLRVDTFWRWTK